MTESLVTSVSSSQIQTPAPSQNQPQNHPQDDKSEKTEKAVFMQIQEINIQVAQFRDLLLNVGQSRDCPELRERIRRLRRNCVESCKSTAQLILPQVRRTTDIGIPVDSQNLTLLFCLVQLFLRELWKSRNLIRIVPMDMTDYYKSRPGAPNIGNAISQILLCKPITVDFAKEELRSIKKDSEEIRNLIDELQEFMPQSDGEIEKYTALQNSANRGPRVNGKRLHRWKQSNDRPSRFARQSYFHGAMNLFCCTARANYV
ncbi:decima [Calliopsis andreniformis]|uniref:decima n=1 Tax=Calliopsis andreniformis TaxID=337506 RepID=UPI003FCDE67A